jgi:glutathione S-transferase
MTLPVLHQFRFSHYNEKVRWAVDHKRIPHRRRSYVPGLHILSMLRLSGQKQVPVWCEDGRAIAGSAAIIDHLERRHPEPPLLPADPAERARTLEVQRYFDDEVGGPLRAAAFVEWLDDGAYMTALFTGHAGPFARGAYRAAFPLVRAAMRADMQLTPARAEEGLARAVAAFDFVAANAGPDGYLVGDRFSLADLAAAAILSPAVLPAEFPYEAPQPFSPTFRRFLDRWAAHPGAAWVREMYRRHRAPSAEARD